MANRHGYGLPKRRLRGVEEQIQEAIEEGKFDNLPGKGQPLPPTDYDQAPPEERLAQKIIKDAGYVPEWIDLEKEIRQDWVAAEEMLFHFRTWQERMWDEFPSLSLGERDRLQSRIDAERDRVREAYAELLVDLKKKVWRFNLLVPLVNRQMMGVRVEEQLAAFEAEFPRRHTSPLAPSETAAPLSAGPSPSPGPRTWVLQAKEIYARFTRRTQAFARARERPREE